MTFQLDLKITTKDQAFAELCKRYWELDDEGGFLYKVSELSRDYGVSSSELTRLVSEHASAISPDDLCSKCQTPHVFTSRSDFQQRNRSRTDWICEECKREEAEMREAERLRTQQRYRAIIQEQYQSVSPGPVSPTELSLDSAVYLLSFIRLLAIEDFSLAQPLGSAKRRLSPTHDLDMDITKRLYREDLISIDPNSQLEAFVGDKAERFYLDKVQWQLPFGLSSGNPKDFASELEEALGGDDWPPGWRSRSLDIWREVALNECLQYLKIALGEHGFELHPGDKTLLVFTSLIQTFSVAQIYNMIWRAAKDAAAFYVRERVTKQHAANTVVGNIQRYGERARAEGWTVKPFSRNFDCPQSVVSEVLFNLALRIGDDGFRKVPSAARLGDLRHFTPAVATELVQ